MYVDLIIFIVLSILVIMFFKRFSSFVFFVAIFDIALRILTFIKNNIPAKDISDVMGKYIPTGILGIIAKYTDKPITLLLDWVYVAIMSVFLFYICKILFKRRKI